LIDESNAAVEAAKVKVNEWAESQKAAAQNKIAEWKAKGDAKSLQLRADIAEGYAKAMSVIATSAVESHRRHSLRGSAAVVIVPATVIGRTIGGAGSAAVRHHP
jgi:hypothetical protein